MVALRKVLGNWIWWPRCGIPNWEARVVRWGDLVLLPWQRGAGHLVGRQLGDGVNGLVEGDAMLGGFSERGLVKLRRQRC